MTLRTHTTFWHKGCLLVKLSKSQTAHVRLFEFVTLSNVPLIGKGLERPKILIRYLKAISRKFTLRRGLNFKISLGSCSRIGLYTNRMFTTESYWRIL